MVGLTRTSSPPTTASATSPPSPRSLSCQKTDVHLHKCHNITIFARKPNANAMSTTLSLHHIVINTYCRKMTITSSHCEDIYRYIWSIIDSRKCRLLRIGGIENHIHIFVDVHPSVGIADLVGEIKRKSSLWMKRSGMFPAFEGWGREYFSFSKSQTDKSTVIEYIKNQRVHHGRQSFEDELEEMAHNEGIAWIDGLLT